jgi:hypothetical protein
VVTIANVLDEVDLGTDLVVETGIAVEKDPQAVRFGAAVILGLSGGPCLGAAENDHADKSDLMIHTCLHHFQKA